jgi:hypothetical protein
LRRARILRFAGVRVDPETARQVREKLDALISI